MLHLDAERLAARDHDPLTSDELAHLAQCATCRRERDAFDRLAALAQGERERTAARLTSWAVLSSALRDEGLITRPSDVPELPAAVEVARPRSAREPLVATTIGDALAPTVSVAASRHGAGRVRGWRTTAWRAAAAVLVFASGAVVGRGTAMPPLAVSTAALPSDAATGLATASLSSGADAFRSVEDATLALERAQREYERASFWLASHDTTVNAQSVYRARLAALEQMLNASRAGLFEAPQDPVLNQYYLAAYTAREATLRQLGEAMPVDRVMESF
jgi:hypothetical protein